MIDLPANPVDGQEVTFDDRTWVWAAGVGGHIGAWNMKPVSEGDANIAAAAASTAVAARNAAQTAQGKAQQWATKTDGEVEPGQGRGAKYYAEQAAATLADRPTRDELAEPDGSNDVGFALNSTAAVTRTVMVRDREWISIKDFGAIGDGFSHPVSDWITSGRFANLAAIQVAYPHVDALDCEIDWAAIQAAINYANGKFLVEAPCGVYILNRGIKSAIALTHVRGAINSFVYGISPAATVFKWTGFAAGDTRKIGVDTYANPTDYPTISNIAYVTWENIALNGNGVGLVGYDGGFLTTHKNLTIVGFTLTNGVGYRIGRGQTSTHLQSSYNGNYHGCTNVSGGTLYFNNCLFRQNLQHGFMGPFGGSTASNCIFESNGAPGVNITTGTAYGRFDTCYWEQNDAANGALGFNLIFNGGMTNANGNVFEGCIFGSTGNTKAARIMSGRVQFNNCNQVGSIGTEQLVVDVGAEVILYKSFPASMLPKAVKIAPEVTVDRSSALRAGTGQIVINSPAMIFGSADFAVGMTLEPNYTGTTIRDLIYGNTNAFRWSMSGSAEGLSALNFFKVGSAAFKATTVSIKRGTPIQLLYSRVAGVGHVYVNGIEVDSFADANDYSVTQSLIGNGTLQSDLFSYSVWVGSSVDAAGAFELWRHSGNATAAGLAPTFDIDFTNRIFDRVRVRAATPRTLPMSGDMHWLNPIQTDGWSGVVGSVSGVLDLSAASIGSAFRASVSGNITSLLFPATPYDGQTLTLQLINSAAFTVAGWPASVRLAGGAFTLTAVAGKADTLVFKYAAGDLKWYEISRSQNC